MQSHRLSSKHTVSSYQALAAAESREEIAALLVERFEERYLTPADADRKVKHGFAMMALACLTIESLESFRRGWEDTKNRSELAFCSFFSTWSVFAEFRPVSQEFYRHVRCGLLHQAETTGGWKIVRTGPLLSDRTINATKFISTLRQVLKQYAAELTRSDWNGDVWKACRKKFSALCRNTQPGGSPPNR